MTVSKTIESLIKYSEIPLKNIQQYKDSVPPAIFLNYANLMTTIAEIQATGKFTDSMKNKVRESLKELGIRDTDNIVIKNTSNERDMVKDDNNKDNKTGGKKTAYEYFVIGDLTKCFGEECQKLLHISSNITGRDFRDRIENWFYTTGAFRDLRRVLCKLIIQYDQTNNNTEDVLMGTCIKEIKKQVISIIADNNLTLDSKLPDKPIYEPEGLNDLELNELAQIDVVRDYMSELEIYAGQVAAILQTLLKDKK